MKKILTTLILITSSLLAAPQDYSYKVLEVTEIKDKNDALTSVYIKVYASKDSDFYIYPQTLDSKQFSLYKTNVNNLSKICEDLFAIAKARLDLQIEQKPKEVKYEEPQKEAITIDKTAIDAKGETVKDDQKKIIKE